MPWAEQIVATLVPDGQYDPSGQRVLLLGEEQVYPWNLPDPDPPSLVGTQYLPTVKLIVHGRMRVVWYLLSSSSGMVPRRMQLIPFRPSRWAQRSPRGSTFRLPAPCKPCR